MDNTPEDELLPQDSDEQKIWFDYMDGYLNWKVSGPDINNPYKQIPTIPYLKRMLTDENFLMTHIVVRCTCDGHEVLILNNPTSPRIQSDHPCLTSLPANAIMDYIFKNKLDEMIYAEVDKIKEDIRLLVKSLEGKKPAEEQRKDAKSKANNPTKPMGKPKDNGPRIIRR
jgi:hypothetical protein